MDNLLDSCGGGDTTNREHNGLLSNRKLPGRGSCAFGSRQSPTKRQSQAVIAPIAAPMAAPPTLISLSSVEQVRAWLDGQQHLSEKAVSDRVADLQEEQEVNEVLEEMRNSHTFTLYLYYFAASIFDHRHGIVRSKVDPVASETEEDLEKMPAFASAQQGWLWARTNKNDTPVKVYASLKQGTLVIAPSTSIQTLALVDQRRVADPDDPCGFYPLTNWLPIRRKEEGRRARLAAGQLSSRGGPLASCRSGGQACNPMSARGTARGAATARGADTFRNLVPNTRLSSEITLEQLRPLVGREPEDIIADVVVRPPLFRQLSGNLVGFFGGESHAATAATAAAATAALSASKQARAADKPSLSSWWRSRKQEQSAAVNALEARQRGPSKEVTRLILSFEPPKQVDVENLKHAATEGAPASASSPRSRASSDTQEAQPARQTAVSLDLTALKLAAEVDSVDWQSLVQWDQALQQAYEVSQRIDDFCIRPTDAAIAAEHAAKNEHKDKGQGNEEKEESLDDESPRSSMAEDPSSSIKLAELRRDHVVKEGYLLRRTRHDTKWARRYFVLTNDGRLQWFLSATEGKSNDITPAAKEASRKRLKLCVRDGRTLEGEQPTELLLRFFAVCRLQHGHHPGQDSHLGLHPSPDSIGADDPFFGIESYEESEATDTRAMLESCERFELRSGNESLQLASQSLVAEQWVEVLRFQSMLNYHKSLANEGDTHIKVLIDWLDGKSSRQVPINEHTTAANVVLSMCKFRFRAIRNDAAAVKKVEKATADLAAEWCLCELQTHRRHGERVELPLHKLGDNELILDQLLLRWEEATRREYGLVTNVPPDAFRLVMRRVALHAPALGGASRPKPSYSHWLMASTLEDMRAVEVAQAKMDLLSGRLVQNQSLRVSLPPVQLPFLQVDGNSSGWLEGPCVFCPITSLPPPFASVAPMTAARSIVTSSQRSLSSPHCSPSPCRASLSRRR